MKYFLSFFFIATILTSCSIEEPNEAQYDIYASVLDKTIGHLSPNNYFKIGINDTIKDFKDELGILIYSVQSNDRFFEEYCDGDSSFKNFILSIRTVETDIEIMDLNKLKAKTHTYINLYAFTGKEKSYPTISFSKIIFNKPNDKAILFITDHSSGSWVLAELKDGRWNVRHQVGSWAV